MSSIPPKPENSAAPPEVRDEILRKDAMKDYADIVFAPHLGLTERGEMVSRAFNHSAAYAADYLSFKQTQDDRASVAMTQATALVKSRLSHNIDAMMERLALLLDGQSIASITAEKKQFEALKDKHAAEKNEIERLKPELQSLSQLFGILSTAESGMKGYDAETLRHTREATDHLTQFYAEVASKEPFNNTQKNRLNNIAGKLEMLTLQQQSASAKAAMADYLKSGAGVPAPMPAPATAKFRKKTP